MEGVSELVTSERLEGNPDLTRQFGLFGHSISHSFDPSTKKREGSLYVDTIKGCLLSQSADGNIPSSMFDC